MKKVKSMYIQPQKGKSIDIKEISGESEDINSSSENIEKFD